MAPRRVRRRAARPAMEAVGNFVLVFVFGVAIATHSWFAPLVIGASVVTLFWFRNRVPDVYYGPSLTCAMLMRRRIAFREAAALWLIQSGTGLAAAALVGAMVGTRHLIIAASTVRGGTLVAAFALDLVFTFVLCCAVRRVTHRGAIALPQMTPTAGRSSSALWRAPLRSVPSP